MSQEEEMDNDASSDTRTGVEHPSNLSAWSKRPAQPRERQRPGKPDQGDGDANGHNQPDQQSGDHGHANQRPDAFGRGEEESHPDEIPKDLPKIPTGRIILFAIIVLVLFVALFLVGYIPHHHANVKLAQKSQAVQTAKPIVEVSKPKLSDAAVQLELPGDALALQQTSMYPRANGYLSKLYVDIGDHVTQGELLAEISAPELDAQLAASRASLQQAQANEARSQTNYGLAKATLERYQGFFKSGGVTQQQLDERQTNFNQADADLKAAEAAIATSKANVQQLAALQSYERVVAPFSGTITYRPYDLGALLSPSSTGPGLEMFDIARTDILRVFVNVPQDYATETRPGQTAEFLVRNYPNEPFQGIITRTAGAVDLRTRTLRIEIDFPNDSGRLFAGMYGTIRLNVPRRTSQIIVPSSALIFDAQGLRVAIVDPQKKIHFRKVQLGRDFGTTVEVLSGLNGTEQVVDNPGENMAENAEVDVHNAQSSGGAQQPEEPQAPAKREEKQADAG